LDAALARDPEEFRAICGLRFPAFAAAGREALGRLASAGRLIAAGEALRSDRSSRPSRFARASPFPLDAGRLTCGLSPVGRLTA
jgi:hypothetical protein